MKRLLQRTRAIPLFAALLVLLPFLLLAGGIGEARAAGSENVQVRLVPEVTSIQPGAPFRVGVVLEMAPHWHTYWRNPGDAGMATSLVWDLPEGFEADPPAWPYPEWLELQGLVSLAYEGTVMFPVTIRPPADLEPGAEVRIACEVSWLECKELCLPGNAELSIFLPVGDGDKAGGDAAESFARTDRALPVDGTQWQAVFFRHDGGMTLQLELPEGIRPKGEQIRFFAYEQGLFDLAAPPDVRLDDGTVQVDLTISESAGEIPETVSGVVVVEQGWDGLEGRKAVEVSGPIRRGAAPTGSTAAQESTSFALFTAVGAAFLGGLLLNLMPCVFPVISLKILGFVKLADSDPARVWRHGLVFAGGVLVSFWVLAGALVALKAAGQAIGWGFQLQAPGFVAAMAFLFLLLGLNLLGVFEIGTSLTGIGGPSTRSEWSSSFFSGVLATIVATPCTAPFMGAALGFALTQPAWISMLVFTALGVGMALPYLVLSRFPAWLKSIPKPGPWMESLKQGMGFIVMGFGLYLVWVFTGQRGIGGLSGLLTGLFFASVAAWVYGRWGGIARARGTRIVAGVLALLLIVGGYTLAVREPPETGWEPYTAERLAELREAGKPVFIDFTAAWCITCQANKRVALNRDHVQEAFRRAGITLLQADWTDKDPEIARTLERYGRSGVPTYVLYGSGEDAEPRLLPELLTPTIVLDAIESIRAAS